MFISRFMDTRARARLCVKAHAAWVSAVATFQESSPPLPPPSRKPYVEHHSSSARRGYTGEGGRGSGVRKPTEGQAERYLSIQLLRNYSVYRVRAYPERTGGLPPPTPFRLPPRFVRRGTIPSSVIIPRSSRIDVFLLWWFANRRNLKTNSGNAIAF